MRSGTALREAVSQGRVETPYPLAHAPATPPRPLRQIKITRSSFKTRHVS